jgi:hypothetical protein
MIEAAARIKENSKQARQILKKDNEVNYFLS